MKKDQPQKQHEPTATHAAEHPPASERAQTRHLTQRDLARRWALSPRTLERWRWLKQGPCYLKILGRIVYRLEDIEAFEAVHRRDVPDRS